MLKYIVYGFLQAVIVCIVSRLLNFNEDQFLILVLSAILINNIITVYYVKIKKS